MASTSAETVDRGQQTSMIVISIVTTSLGAVSLILRLIGRFIITRKLGMDDWFMIAGMLVQFGYLFEICYGLNWNFGLRGKDISFDDMLHLLQIIYAAQLTYNTILYFVKLSVLAFYLRLATVGGGRRKASWATITFLSLFYLSSQIATALQCLPVRSNWDLTWMMEKKCINKEVYFYVLAVTNIILDIVILVLPMPTLKGIKRDTRQKVVLFVLFGVGGFSCISSIIRLYIINVFTDSRDPFYDGVPINIWSMIEINVAVICASVPAMKPLFTKSIRDRVVTERTHRTFSHQMMPLTGDEASSGLRSGFKEKKESTYTVQATAGTRLGGSEENIVHKFEGIEYEREFTVEESYIGVSRGI